MKQQKMATLKVLFLRMKDELRNRNSNNVESKSSVLGI